MANFIPPIRRKVLVDRKHTEPSPPRLPKRSRTGNLSSASIDLDDEPQSEVLVVDEDKFEDGYVLEFRVGENVTTFECISQKGGLITALKLNGVNIMLEQPWPDQLDGTMFWTSPQSDWGWPPPKALDPTPSKDFSSSFWYDAEVDDSAMSITLTSKVIDGLDVQVVKRFSLDLARQAVVLDYALKNTGLAARSFAPWEITRVPGNGLTFFPTGDQEPTSGDFPMLPVTKVAGATWFQHVASDLPTGHKLFADAARGWLAHASGDMVLAKFFEKLAPPKVAAPGDNQIEIYADAPYVEVEPQGAYEQINPGDQLDWTVRWYLRRLPAEVATTPGPGLVEFVDNLEQSDSSSCRLL